jgi:hypothetical protein
MQKVMRSISKLKLLGAVAALAYGFSASPTPANAQGSQGQNTVCSASSGCATSAQAGSPAFINASMFISSPSSPPPPSNRTCST